MKDNLQMSILASVRGKSHRLASHLPVAIISDNLVTQTHGHPAHSTNEVE